jgi:hypothetical protein
MVRIAEVPKDAVPVADQQLRQLAPGTTRGSRHCISMESRKTASLFTLPKADVLTGMVLATGAAPCEVEHPEHGNVVLPKDSVFQLRFQQAYSPLGELRRQQD